MIQAVHRFVLACILLACVSPASARDIYVAKTGSDGNPGTQEQPLATVEKAVELMRGAGAGTIWIGAGEYELGGGVRLDAQHGGTADSPLVIRGTERDGTRLSGARVVSGFRPLSPEEAAPLVSEEAKSRVVVADLAEQGFPPLDPMPSQHRAHQLEEVVFDDRPMQSARWPNEDFAVFNEVIDPGASGTTHWVQREVYRPGSFRFPGDRAKHWNFERGVWLHGFWCYEWCDEILKADHYKPESGELRLAVKHAYGVGSPWRKDSKHPFYAIHVFEELDQPGEYYLDRQNNRLYFWPPGDIGQKPVRLTVCKAPIILADGVSHLVIRDLTVENGRGTGVQMRNCRHARIENCLVRNLGGTGIDLSGSHVAAHGCEVTQTASRGISIHGGDRKTLTPGHCEVTACHVHHVGRLDWGGGRGVTVGGCGNRAANNLVHHTPTGAFSYGGNEHVLELNEVHNVCIHYSDVGVFYTGRDWASQGNVVRWNYIHSSVNNAGHGSSGIYLDDCDSGDTVVGNIVFGGVGRGVLLGGGRDNTIRGNIFIDLPVGIHVDARGPRGITLDKPGSWNLLAKCEAVDYLSALWRERYPRLAKTMENEPLLPMGNVMHGNVIIGCKRPFGLSKEVKEEWLDRKDNLIKELADFPAIPTVESGKPLDLSVLAAIWQAVPGFEPIPIERIGLPKKE
ncbi:MAG: right-handed parallel beta-helix repeat-containing protein [Patescibacteria group bacterium]|nr:right-handed parallel beta-helix repeat-containing protein [Patescibacteria group bacterium]